MMEFHIINLAMFCPLPCFTFNHSLVRLLGIDLDESMGHRIITEFPSTPFRKFTESVYFDENMLS